MKEKAICIYLNPIFSHHRKLKIGEIYDFRKVEYGDVIYAYSIFKNGEYIGRYDSSLFINLQEWREKQISIILE